MSTPRVCMLGLGKMGGALARRLRDQGHALALWNRSPAKATELAAEEAKGAAAAYPDAAEAVRSTAADGLVVAVLLDTAGVLALVPQLGEALQGRTFVNLTSGNPDEGRAVEAAVQQASGGKATYIDGAYCGPPMKARAGAGRLFLSCEGGQGPVDCWQEVLSEMGGVVFCGKVGASRAIDYAVVDLHFVNLLCFLSNVEMLEREGVDSRQFYEEAGKRLGTLPAFLEMFHGRLANRDEEAYQANPTATLGTFRNFWASRLPWYESRGLPADLTRFSVDLLERAGGGDGHSFSGADVARLQETVRYGKDA